MKKKLFLLATLVSASIGVVMGQSNVDLNFQGLLADIQGNGIGNEPFELSVQLKDESGQELFFNSNTSTRTDEEGWFGFTISGISQYLMVDGRFSKKAVLRLEILPNENTRWIRKGDDFMVTYTLAPSQGEAASKLTITRMEGTELMAHSEEHLLAFKDNYPFAYLTAGFLVSDMNPVNAQSIADLKEWISPKAADDPGGVSRGVKGGFPTGGYHKKN